MATVAANGTQINETTACTFVSTQDVPVPLYPLKTENGHFDDDVDDDVDDDDDEEEGEDDAGSLVDFIVNDDEENNDDDNSSIQSEQPATKEEVESRDMDGIDTSNIMMGKRTRRQTKFYEQEVFNTDEYRKMMLCDVPKEEMHAVMESDDDEEESENDEEDDSSYEGENENEEEEDESSEDESDEEDEKKNKFQKQWK
jgi:hypothetical protein